MKRCVSQESKIVDFSFQVLSGIDRALSRFGQSVSSVIYWKFHYDTKLTKEQIVLRPDLFSSTIKQIFRDGSCVIEESILYELKVEFNLPDRRYKDLEDLMNSVRLMSSLER